MASLQPKKSVSLVKENISTSSSIMPKNNDIKDFIFQYFRSYEIKKKKIKHRGESLLLRLKTIATFDESNLINDDEKWKTEVVLGDEFIQRKLKLHNYKNIDNVDKKIIINWFKESQVKFFITLSKDKLLSNNKGIWEKFGPFKIITAFQALKDFGINKMEKASERGIINI